MCRVLWYLKPVLRYLVLSGRVRVVGGWASPSDCARAQSNFIFRHRHMLDTLVPSYLVCCTKTPEIVCHVVCGPQQAF